MCKIKVTGDFIFLHSGKVRLNEKQAKAREHGLKHVEGDVYEITGPVGFKRGEVFGYDGEIGKSHAEDVEEIRGPGRPSKDPDSKGGKSGKGKKAGDGKQPESGSNPPEDDPDGDGDDEGAGA